MPKLRAFIPRALSARIVLQTVFAIALLLIPTILALTIGTRMIIKEEVGRQVDQALDGITCRLDNTFLSVEQTATLLQEDIPNHLGHPQDLYRLFRKVLASNPSIDGCAIALNPDTYAVNGKPFMAYVHRERDNIVSADSFTAAPFTEQEWYTKPLREGTASWVGPLKESATETHPLLTYAVPVIADGATVGVLGIDLSLSVLTRIAQHYRTSTHSYITLLDRDGSYIVHPDSTRLVHMNSLTRLKGAENPVVVETILAMAEGKTDRRTITLGSSQYLVAYQPFRQSAYPGRPIGDLGWSIAVIYPKQDLNTDFDPGFRLSAVMAIVGILLLFVGATVIARLRLRPLRRLMYVTKIIANGNYKLPGFETSRTDEVGRLQTQYNKMLRAVSEHMEQLELLSQKEAAHQKELAQTYARTKEIKELKGVFFGNMTHQMADVTAEIQGSVGRLCESGATLDEEQTRRELESIERNGLRVTEILNDMLNGKN